MDGSIDRDGTHVAIDGLRAGDIIGPYELLFETAQGGMASVWAARRRGERGTGEVIAIKLLSEALQAEPDARAMLRDEARTAARIVHPNVAKFLDHGEARGRSYMAMEWLEGESLARIASAQRARGGRLPLRWVVHVAAAACAGLHAAHEARSEDGSPLHVVHRDVSPQNVMVTFDGIAKVVDFGVAKSTRHTQVTRVGVIKGKTGYFSPEQVRGEPIDRRSDIFSFGILLYLLTTDRHPFRGRSAVETIQHIATRTPHPPREILPDLPIALEWLILRALANDPAGRFQTAAEVADALEDVSRTLGGRLGDRLVGAVARDLLPGVADGRRAHLASVVERLDRRDANRRSADANGEEAAASADEDDDILVFNDDDTAIEATEDVDASVEDLQEATRLEGRASLTPRFDAVPPGAGAADVPTTPPPPQRVPSLAPLTAAVTLALLGTAIVVARAPDRGTRERGVPTHVDRLVERLSPARAESIPLARQLPRWTPPEAEPPVSSASVAPRPAPPTASAAPRPASTAVVKPHAPPPPKRRRRAHPAAPRARETSTPQRYTPDRI